MLLFPSSYRDQRAQARVQVHPGEAVSVLTSLISSSLVPVFLFFVWFRSVLPCSLGGLLGLVLPCWVFRVWFWFVPAFLARGRWCPWWGSRRRTHFLFLVEVNILRDIRERSGVKINVRHHIPGPPGNVSGFGACFCRYPSLHVWAETTLGPRTC